MRRFHLDQKMTIFAFRGLIFLLLLFFLLYRPDTEAKFPMGPFILVAMYLISNISLLFIRTDRFKKTFNQAVLFLFDIILISALIYVSQGWDSDLYLIYFVVVFMSGIEMKMWQSFLIGTVASILYGLMWTNTHTETSFLNVHLLLRFPFFYLVSFFVGFFVQQAKEGERRVREQYEKQLENKIEELKKANIRLEETQSQLIQSEKLAAIGELAAGVAHELNNPMTGILGFAQILLQGKNLNAQQKEDLESICSQSERCSQIIRNLLQFSRRREPQREAVNPISMLEAAIKLVRYEFSTSGVEITCNFPNSVPPPVYADPSQLQQVILNMLTNAKQAMEDKKPGKLSIQAGYTDEKVDLKFTDNGSGISANNLPRIFDPFFTTKPVGKGTGLGLSISYGIIEHHGGTINVDTEEGKGTTFTIELPVYKGQSNGG
ncbi:sensor histidine kinase [Elusimicrobiota bacterium]